MKTPTLIILSIPIAVFLADHAAAQDHELPVYFIENRGVFPDQVKYFVQGADKALFFTREGITFRLKNMRRSWVVKLEFVGANPQAVPRSEEPQQAVFSYFTGPEKDWKTGLRTFTRVVYEDLWPGIDLVYRGTVDRLKYEFRVEAGADPEKIRLRYRGATSVRETDAGSLRVETPAAGFEDAPPVVYQVIDGRHTRVAAAYALDGKDPTAYGFRVAAHDRTRPLIIDPALLVYCGFIGGGSTDIAAGITVDAAGNVYVTGRTSSDQQTFPVGAGPDLTYNGVQDVFVAKVNSQGTGLVYCGYIGGSSYDYGEGIAVDAAGNAKAGLAGDQGAKPERPAQRSQ